MNEDDIQAAKIMFAAITLKEPGEPFKAALSLFPPDATGAALRAANEWPSDPIVKAEQARLVAEQENGELDFLPTKAQAARRAWDMAHRESAFVEDQLKALKLYAEIRGFIAKPEAVKIDNSVTHNRVMVVKDHGSDDDWEAKARKQQANLVSEAKAPNAATTKH